MEVQDIRQAFAARINEVCDDLQIPRGHGRQTALGKLFGVTPKGARKWLVGAGYPDMAMAVRIANAARVNVNWLLQGLGPKRGEHYDLRTVTITEGIEELPSEDRKQVFEFIRYKFDKADGWFAEEKLARYMTVLDQLAKASTGKPN